MSAALITLTVVPVVFLLHTPLVIAQSPWSPCPGPGHLATEAEARSATGGSIIAGHTLVCERDALLGINADVGNAKIYLANVHRTGTARETIRIEQLNHAFAICAKKFFEEYQNRYGQITITSIYRTPEEEAQLCINNPRCGALMNNPHPNGNHQKGLAMDVKAANQSTLINFARQNPQFGVCFPFTGEGGGFYDPMHMILAGIPSAETRGPGCRGVTKSCSAGKFDPNTIDSPFPGWATALGPDLSQSSYPFMTSQFLPPMPPPMFPLMLPYMPPPMLPPMPLPMPPYSPLPQQNTTPVNTPTSMPTPISNQQSTSSTTPASLIIAQSTRIPRRGSTLISWASVGTAPDSCTVIRNGVQFSTGNQGSQLLPAVMTGTAGTIVLVLDCINFAGTHSRNSVSVVVQ